MNIKNNNDYKIWYENSLKKFREKHKNINIMASVKIEKIVLNIGLKDAVSNGKIVDSALKVLSSITGQKPIKTLAKKSIAGFKLRKGMIIGVCVTLRKDRMKSFLSKFVNLALPRVRDFQGLSDSFDKNGNFNLGLKDITVFPEAESSVADFNSGLNISFVTSTKSDILAKELFSCFNIPFVKK